METSSADYSTPIGLFKGTELLSSTNQTEQISVYEGGLFITQKTLSYNFTNATEATLKFPKYSSSILSKFIIHHDSQEYKSTISEKNRSYEKYDDSVSQGNSSSLVTVDDIIYEINIGNFSGTVSVILIFIELKEIIYNDFLFIKCDQTVTLKDKNYVRQNGMLVLDKYPLVNWVVEKNSNGYSHMVTFISDFETKKSYTELVIIVDLSGSMATADRIGMTKECLKLLMFSLDEGVYYNIVVFGSTFKMLFEKSVLIDQHNFNVAVKFIGGLKANMGGTNLYNPVKHVLEQEVVEGYSRQVFILTDGDTDDNELVLDCVYNNSIATRFFMFGIGHDLNDDMIMRCADYSDGKFVFIRESKQIEEKVLQQLDNALQVALTGFSTNFKDLGLNDVVEISDIRSDIVFNRKRYNFFYFTSSIKDDMELSINYSLYDSKKTVKVKPKMFKFEENEMIIGKLAASKLIQSLSDKKKIIDLSLKYSVLSEYTCFYLEIENDKKILRELEVCEEDIKEDSQSYGNYSLPSPVNKPSISDPMKQTTDKNQRFVDITKKRELPQSKESEKKNIFQKMFQKKQTESDKIEINISLPTNAKRDLHIEFNKNQGFVSENLPKEWSSIFEESGIIKEDYSDPEKASKLLTSLQRFQGKKDVDDNDDKEEDNEEMGHLNASNLNKLLFKSTMKGIWKYEEEFYSTLFNIDGKIIVEQNPIKSVDLWLTLIIINLLKKYFIDHRIKWKFIVKKSMKSLQKSVYALDIISKSAEEFVNKYLQLLIE